MCTLWKYTRMRWHRSIGLTPRTLLEAKRVAQCRCVSSRSCVLNEFSLYFELCSCTVCTCRALPRTQFGRCSQFCFGTSLPWGLLRRCMVRIALEGWYHALLNQSPSSICPTKHRSCVTDCQSFLHGGGLMDVERS